MPFFEKCILQRIVVLMSFVVGFVLSVSDANAKDDIRLWKAVKGTKSIQVAIRCLDASQGRTCYWWFRNSGDSSVSLVYTMIGDGFTIKPTVIRIKGGTIVPKTEIVLRPKYEQPDIEGYSGQYIGAEDLREVSIISYRSEVSASALKTVNESGAAPKRVESAPSVARVDSTFQLPAASKTEERAEGKKPQGFCKDFVEVMLDSCRCLPGRKIMKYADIARMTCYVPDKEDSKSEKSKARSTSSSLSSHQVVEPYGPPPPPKKKPSCDNRIASCL